MAPLYNNRIVLKNTIILELKAKNILIMRNEKKKYYSLNKKELILDS